MALRNGNGGGHHRQEPDENYPLVLVVDDRDADLEYTAALLGRNGFRVVQASSYVEAVRYLEHQVFSAAIVDYWLEDRLAETGEDLLRRARELRPSCALVMFSADVIAEEAAERCGAAFFSKDHTASGLVALLRQATKRAGMI